jgi:hypothetical protein
MLFSLFCVKLLSVDYNPFFGQDEPDIQDQDFRYSGRFFRRTVMSTKENVFARRQAEHHFRRARQQARRDVLARWLTGRGDPQLIPFDAVRDVLREEHPCCQGLQQVPLENIVGSVSRYNDFTGHFLPLKESLRERWINVQSYAVSHGWPPVDLYKVGEAYFVSDGNHRVAIARQMGYDTIEAYVWEFPARVNLQPDESLDEVLIALEEEQFMAQTGLDQRFPEQSIYFTTPGGYREIQAQVVRLQQKLSIIDGEELPYVDAVDAWYEMSYLPAVQIIKEAEVMDSFPGRTEADLFVWLSRNREALRAQYGDYENVADLVQWVAEDWQPGHVKRLVDRVLGLFGRAKAPIPLPDLAEDTEP